MAKRKAQATYGHTVNLQNGAITVSQRDADTFFVTFIPKVGSIGFLWVHRDELRQIVAALSVKG